MAAFDPGGRLTVLRDTDTILLAEDIQPRRLAWGARSIAAYLNKPERWLRRQLERAKRPPPVFRVGSAVVADLDELDAWIAAWRQRADSKRTCTQ
jgi:hypothetical protein